MSSVLAVKLVSGLRRKPKPSGRISSTPSANTCSPALARFLMMANINSCLRIRPVFSISSSSACFRTSDTCSALSSFKCMERLLGGVSRYLGGVGLVPRELLLTVRARLGDLGPVANACKPVIWRNYDRKKMRGSWAVAQCLPWHCARTKRADADRAFGRRLRIKPIVGR